MTLLKIIFLPIYLPFAIIINIFKFIGMIGFMNGVMKFFD